MRTEQRVRSCLSHPVCLRSVLSRPLRIEFSGAVNLVMSRGDQRGLIYLDN